MEVYVFAITFIVIIFNYYLVESLNCVDDNNEELDWFSAYKIPKIKHKNKLIEEGTGYVYLTSKDWKNWKLSKYSINDSNSMIGRTLNLFYTSQENISYVLYNDQPPSEPIKSSKGHTKGVILTDLESGFWLIHSVPHFPPLSSTYKFSQTGILKGQSFLCISLDLKNLNKVGVQLQYNEPQIYASNVLTPLKTKLKEIEKAVIGNVVKQPPWYNKIDLDSRKGVRFLSFAKSKKFGKDLYEDWIAPALQTDLYTETWLNGAGRLASNCSKTFKVYNIEKLLINVTNVSFADSQDHSKWAVAANASWTCIGDINRMNHQKFRGGGSVCLDNKDFSNAYKKSILSIEKCQTNIK